MNAQLSQWSILEFIPFTIIIMNTADTCLPRLGKNTTSFFPLSLLFFISASFTSLNLFSLNSCFNFQIVGTVYVRTMGHSTPGPVSVTAWTAGMATTVVSYTIRLWPYLYNGSNVIYRNTSRGEQRENYLPWVTIVTLGNSLFSLSEPQQLSTAKTSMQAL